MIDYEYGRVGGMRIGRENRSTRRKPTPVSLCPPQIPHDLTWARTRAAAVLILPIWNFVAWCYVSVSCLLLTLSTYCWTPDMFRLCRTIIRVVYLIKVYVYHIQNWGAVQSFTHKEPRQNRRASHYQHEQKASMRKHHRARFETT
jgi:hypothetical protein